MRGRRALAAGLALLCCGGPAACGSGSDGASEDRYRGALDTFCQTVETGARRFTTDAVALQRSSKPQRVRLRRISTGLETFADTIDGGLARFRRTPAPDAYTAFNRDAVRGLGSLVSTLHHASASAGTGDRGAVLGLRRTLEGVRLPRVPEALADDTPACRRISADRAARG